MIDEGRLNLLSRVLRFRGGDQRWVKWSVAAYVRKRVDAALLRDGAIRSRGSFGGIQ